MSKSKSGFVKKLGYRSRPESPRVAGLKMRYFLTDTGEERIVVYTLGGREDGLEVDYTVGVVSGDRYKGGVSVERLTYRHKDQNGNPTDCISQQINLKYVPRKDWLEKIAIRLADIEDILGDDYDLERLRELVEAYRDGRCAPLKPGDIVTCIWYGRPTQNKVERINFYWVDDGIDWYAITTSTTGSKECFGKDEWGKTVFPTYEAAEAALKGK